MKMSNDGRSEGFGSGPVRQSSSEFVIISIQSKQRIHLFKSLDWNFHRPIFFGESYQLDWKGPYYFLLTRYQLSPFLLALNILSSVIRNLILISCYSFLASFSDISSPAWLFVLAFLISFLMLLPNYRMLVFSFKKIHLPTPRFFNIYASSDSHSTLPWPIP